MPLSACSISAPISRCPEDRQQSHAQIGILKPSPFSSVLSRTFWRMVQCLKTTSSRKSTLKLAHNYRKQAFLSTLNRWNPDGQGFVCVPLRCTTTDHYNSSKPRSRLWTISKMHQGLAGMIRQRLSLCQRMCGSVFSTIKYVPLDFGLLDCIVTDDYLGRIKGSQIQGLSTLAHPPISPVQRHCWNHRKQPSNWRQHIFFGTGHSCWRNRGRGGERLSREWRGWSWRCWAGTRWRREWGEPGKQPNHGNSIAGMW